MQSAGNEGYEGSGREEKSILSLDYILPNFLYYHFTCLYCSLITLFATRKRAHESASEGAWKQRSGLRVTPGEIGPLAP